MSFATSDTVPSRFGLHSRIALALAHAAVDSQTKQGVVAFGSSVQDDGHDYVQDLLNECAAVWGELLNNPFPIGLAKGTAALNGFRHYMVQDGTYLEYYYRVRMESVGKTGTFEEVQEIAAKLSSSLQSVAGFRDDLTSKLGVPRASVTGEAKSTELQNSLKLYQSVVESGDWLDLHIVLLPCILGYDTIATRLLRDPDTIRNTLYFPWWIQFNSGGSSATKYKKFINDNIGKLSSEQREKRWPGWVKNFTTACGTEKAFFGLGIPSATNKIPAYKVVEDGTYKLRNYRNNYFLVANADSSVTTVAAPGPDQGKWKLTNATDAGGYIIESVSEKKGFLTGPVEPLPQPTYDVKVTNEQTKQEWPINTVGVYNQGGRPVVQVFLPGKLEFVLDAGRDVNNPKAFVTNNSQISSQLWLLDPAT